VVVDPASYQDRIPKAQLALVLMAAAAMRTGVIPPEALQAAGAGPFAGENLPAIAAGFALAG
jgi:hypothetical protein